MRNTLLCLLLLITASGSSNTTGDASNEEVPDGSDIDTIPDAGVDADAIADAAEEPTTPCILPGTPCVDSGCDDGPWLVDCVGAQVVDDTLATLTGIQVETCLGETCVLSVTDETGWFTADLPNVTTPDIVISFPDAEGWVRPYCLMEGLCDGPMRFCASFVLRPAPSGGTTVPSDTLTEDIREEDSTGGAVILPTGSEVEFPTGADRVLTMVEVNPRSLVPPCFLEAGNLPLQLYAFLPDSVYVLDPDTGALAHAGLDLPNDSSLPAGREFDVYILGGTDPERAGLTKGEWTRVASAQVTTDGTRIQTAPGEGIGYLTWVGIYTP